ncbi:MAG: DUF899 family protein [Myxococcales bacterium]|nr:DUF899 domain-containing protein [Myxococcales bacterium]HIK86818.1 DUF899 domain-containing protein [Myxococcales bacterium]
MADPDWEDGCPSHSFWAGNYDRVILHRNRPDITMVAISNTPVGNLHAYRERMDWSFK